MFNNRKQDKEKDSGIFDSLDYKKLYDILSGKYNHLEQILVEKDKIIKRTQAEVSSNVTRELFTKFIIFLMTLKNFMIILKKILIFQL